ncbi:SDR family oxidoreductase [Bradyrhizobium sp.]|jgi:uncharacterized protein YbjT (DUF2867 family)|uniref:SDR family oxidoreductase n=1 Tax=Bradyrhizobium sp. TaxID=376 RepID=UPI003C1E9ED3
MREAVNILVLGASGLIGRCVTDELRQRGFRVTGIARRYAPSQRAGSFDLEIPVLSMGSGALTGLIRDHDIGVVVNCIGVLQDGPGSDVSAVHRDFVARLLRAISDSRRAVRLIHISIPGAGVHDRTAFSRTKREAERLITASGASYAILRPGFVIAPQAYGGGALLRALAALPIKLPAAETATPFQTVSIEDVVTTIAWLASRDISDKAAAAVVWDLMAPQPVTLGAVIGQFRRSLGVAKSRPVELPAPLLDLGAKFGDLASWLGWLPPIRTTALAELRRGVAGDPAPWMATIGIVPKTLAQAVGHRSASIQDKWFARLYLIKALVIGSLVLFWTVSGFIALVISYDAAAALLTSHHFPPALVAPITVGTSLMDMAIGLLIACRRTCAGGLIAGITAALGYMLGATILTPDLWIEPLGALVKTAPAIVLMLVALLTLDGR